MKQFLIKKKSFNLFYSIPSIIFLVIVIVFMLRTLSVTYNKKVSAEIAVNQATNNLRQLEEEENKIASQIDYLESPEGIEAELRQRFRVGREGEEIAVIVKEDENISTSQIATSTEKASKISNFLRLIGF